MAFLRSVNAYDIGPAIYGDRVMLRTPQLSDYGEWADLRATSRSFLVPWEPSWPRDDLTKPAFRRRLKRYQRDLRDDLAYPFFIFDSQTSRLTGGITLSNVRRGVAQAAAVGYWAGAPYARQGYLTRALRCLIPFAFENLRFHRLEAACLPRNAASIGLLEKVGFTREGYARGYLCINGAWQDHLLYGLLRDDYPGAIT
ncbi:MAG: GNAT family N-acetyltransferase [Rhodobiaceae bacterium]|nr:GNAT family N-acetyltransferase [Rhodobiaceae bacterium]